MKKRSMEKKEKRQKREKINDGLETHKTSKIATSIAASVTLRLIYTLVIYILNRRCKDVIAIIDS